MATRMKDIARDLGVSVMTVSKVLRNHSDIGEATRQRVLERIRELNYTPNAAARALVTGRSNVVGLVVPDLVHPFFGELAKGLSAVIRDQNYSLVISSSEEDPALEQREIRHLLARGVDALVIASVQSDVSSFVEVAERGTPYILIDRRVEGLTANFIGVDDERMGFLATEHLVQTGCRRVAHIAGTGLSSGTGRLRGYRLALEKYGLVPPPEYVVSRAHVDDLGDVTGHEAMRKLLALAEPPDGVFCFNDPAAMGAMLAILEAGLEIPGDVAVAGCGDVHYARYLRVPLTSVAQQTKTIGRSAGEMVLALLDSDGAPPPRTVLLTPELQVRASTRR